MKYWILAYYFLGEIIDPQTEILRHKKFFGERDFRGRIYISEQGINGQASGSREAAEEYIAWMHRDPRFSDMPFKVQVSQEHVFPRMTVKYRRQLVAIDYEVDLSLRAEAIPPKKWKEMLEERDEETLLLDVRNDYEWQVGHFEGAELPALETFRQFPSYAKELKKRCDPEKTSVMMYCTGGIRCEFYSSVLKREGFERVYQLEGGVIGYGQQMGADHWKGKLFVFDDRLVVPISSEEAPAVASCKLCQTACDVYYNCANMDCNALFICCSNCLKEQCGCCSEECLGKGRVRPYQRGAKPFRKLGYEEKRALG